MKREFTQHELEAYLDEALAPQEMAALEAALRQDKQLVKRLAAINARRDAGVHTLGEVWRRHGLSCPTRAELGSYLLQALDQDLLNYIRFHVDQIGCRVCRANVDDLKSQQEESTATVTSRRKKYLQSSAGYLRRE